MMPHAASVQPQAGITASPVPRTPAGQSFEQVLAQQQGLKFSSHASQRIDQRNITLDGVRQARLSGAVDQAARKGSRTSLVLVDGNAFVVNVPNRTVITAVGSDAARGNLFTNIDSTVIA